MNSDEISALVENMDKEVAAIRREVLKFCWYMRGGITYEEAMMLSNEERNIISTIITENLETTKKSGLPFF